MRGFKHTLKTTKIVGRVAEIVTLRPKKDVDKANTLLKKKTLSKKSKNELYKKLEEHINMKDITFCLKPLRSIPDVGNTLSLYDDPNKDEQHETSRIHITNSGDVIFLDRISKLAYFNNINLAESFKKDMNSYKWSFSQRGLLAFNNKDIYYLTTDPKTGKPEKAMKIDFKVDVNSLVVDNVHGCPNGRYVAIALTNKYTESILLVWDLQENREKYNYSLDGNYSFITKPNSEYGIVL